MIGLVQPPGTWKEFVKKPENIKLPIQEASRKYNQHLLLFENQLSMFQQNQNAISHGGPRKRTLIQSRNLLTESELDILTENLKFLEID